MCFSGNTDGADLICFKDMANYIISDKWYTEKKSDIEDETERIIIAASKLIMSDIRQATYATDNYPTYDEVKQDRLDCLILMTSLVSSKLKQASIGK